MKFLCGNCKAKYQIADEKVSGRTLRMKCRRCGHDILIDGHNMPQSTPPAVSTPARRTASTVSVMPGSTARGASGAQAAPALRPGAPSLPRPAAGRSKPPSGLSADFRRHVAAPPEVPQRTAPYDLWHAAIQDVPVGPMTRDELARKIDAGAVTPESLCWREGMDDWRPLGELPELAQLLRRTRDVSRPGRARPPPSVPANQRGPHSRSAPLPVLPDDDDDGGEATRISDFTPPLMPDSQSSPAIFAPPNASTTSPKVLLPATSQAGPLPTAETNGHIQAPTAVARGGSSQMTTGIAIGMLVMIVFLGGPALYKATWGSEPAAPVRPEQPVAKVEPPRAVEPTPVAVSIDAPEESVDKTQGQSTKTPNSAKIARPAKVEEKPAAKTLSDEQRKLLARMGGGSDDPDLSKVNTGRGQDNGGGQPGGPALTPQQLTKVVQDNKTQLQRCYETALRAAGGKQDAAIKISVNVVVGTSGSAKSVSTQGDGLGNMTDCIRSGVKRWRFPQSGGESEFAFPLVFQPGA
ncbi:MAG: Fe-S oxidoreductase [Myxococcaceae bacterium]|nr:Fe-S oxidoreductase [Myxococcaceae bacterium]